MQKSLTILALFFCGAFGFAQEEESPPVHIFYVIYYQNSADKSAPELLKKLNQDKIASITSFKEGFSKPGMIVKHLPSQEIPPPLKSLPYFGRGFNGRSCSFGEL